MAGCWTRLLSPVADFDIIAPGQRLGALEILQKLAIEELRGNDAGEGHVVRFAKGLPLIDFGHQLGNGVGMKEAGFAEQPSPKVTLGRMPLRVD